MPLSIYSESSAQEPLTLELVKLQVALPPDEPHPNDPLITDVLIPAVRQRCEAATGRQLRVVTFDWTLDGYGFPGGVIEVPRPPLLDVVHMKHYDSTGTLQTLVLDTDYIVQAINSEKAARGRIALPYGRSWPTVRGQMGDVTIRFRAGYGAAGGPQVPAFLKLAMLQHAANAYRYRGDDDTRDMAAAVESTEHGWVRKAYWSWKSHPTQALDGVAV